MYIGHHIIYLLIKHFNVRGDLQTLLKKKFCKKNPLTQNKYIQQLFVFKFKLNKTCGTLTCAVLIIPFPVQKRRQQREHMLRHVMLHCLLRLESSTPTAYRCAPKFCDLSRACLLKNEQPIDFLKFSQQLSLYLMLSN